MKYYFNDIGLENSIAKQEVEYLRADSGGGDSPTSSSARLA